MKPDQNKQIATFALQVLESATVSASNQAQQNLAVLKAWLQAIKGGALWVSLAATPVEVQLPASPTAPPEPDA